MAPAAVIQNLKVWIVSLGGTASGDEERLIGAVRKRLNVRFVSMDNERVAASAFAFGVEPLATYMTNAVPAAKLRELSNDLFAEAVCDGFRIVASRTRLSKRFALVLDSERAWTIVEDALARVRRGASLEAPATSDGVDAPAPTGETPPPQPAPWWARRRAVSATGALVSAMVYQARGLLELGKNRLYVAMFSLFLLLASLFFWRSGHDHLPALFWASSETDAAESDDGVSEASTGVDGESESGVGASPTRPAAHFAASPTFVEPRQEAPQPELQSELRAEMAAMRQALAEFVGAPRPTGAPAHGAQAEASPSVASGLSGPMAALSSFVNNQAPEGHISQTAARMAAAQGAPGLPVPAPVVPAGYQPAAGVGWAPFTGAARVQSQASCVRTALNNREAGKSLNPYWSNLFWHDLEALEAQEAFEPDLRRVLCAAGYCGPGTTGPPKGALRPQLDALIATGAPPHGARAAVPQMDAGWLDRALHQNLEWEDQLPPDLPRAAPEIYRSCRAAGATSIRNWLDRHYSGSRDDKSKTWVDLWNAATRVDFGVARHRGAQEVSNFLANDDFMEIDLRRLASEEYMARTGDQVGANQMLAVKAPGIGVDLAPSWLVREVTDYRRNDHQRRERVRANSRPADRGRGRAGRDGRGGGRGGDASGHASEEQGGGASANASARGRGGRGRRGRG